jgi:hypothetical protein
MVKSTFEEADHLKPNAESKNDARKVVMVCFPALMMSASSSP